MMNRNSSLRAALLLGFAWLAGAQPLEVLKTKGLDAELTVVPVKLGDIAILPDIGEMIAVFLESGGMRKVDWTSQTFARPAAATLAEVTAAFGDYARSTTAPGEYFLYMEVLGAPDVGITEIRGFLADKRGNPVWNYRQSADDEEFKKVRPKDPAGCITMLINALRGPLGLRDPFGPDVYKGRLSERVEKRAGLPTDGERAEMQKALTTARGVLSKSTLAVFPVAMSGRPNAKQAAHLAKILTREKLARAKATPVQPAIEIQDVPNEQQRLWQMARSIREWVRRNPSGAAYAILADYLFAPDGRAWTVHFVICDRKGEWVIVDFQNGHSPDFDPEMKSGDDCDRLVAKRLGQFLRTSSNLTSLK